MRTQAQSGFAFTAQKTESSRHVDKHKPNTSRPQLQLKCLRVKVDIVWGQLMKTIGWHYAFDSNLRDCAGIKAGIIDDSFQALQNSMLLLGDDNSVYPEL